MLSVVTKGKRSLSPIADGERTQKTNHVADIQVQAWHQSLTQPNHNRMESCCQAANQDKSNELVGHPSATSPRLAQCALQIVNAVCLLPRETTIRIGLAAKVTIGGRTLVNRLVQP